MTRPTRGLDGKGYMSIIYDIFFGLLALVYFPFLLVRKKWHSGFKMRFGFFLPSFVKEIENKRCIWIHAVSVGEILAVSTLIKRLKERLPEHTIVCSTVTKTGYKIASETLVGECTVIYAPLDFSWIVRKFVSVIGPEVYISAETEIWPNLYRTLQKNGIPVIQINGRISDKAFKGYKQAGFFLKPILSQVDLFYMQSLDDADRIKRLGAVPERIHVVGNLKFDNIECSTEAQKEDFGFHDNDDLLIGGSTHTGEEAILIDAYRKLQAKFSNLRLVIAPRHIERVDEIIRLVQEKGYKAVRLSQISKRSEDAKAIVVVDTMGQLRALYSFAKIVFIGKTLTVGGGQNMIEPACFGKPTIVGPLTQNFRSVVDIFLKSQALIQVSDHIELFNEIQNLLANPKRANEIGKAAQQTVNNHQGATLKTVEAITELLEQSK